MRYLFIVCGEILVTEMQTERRRVYHLSLIHLPDSPSFRWLWRLSWHDSERSDGKLTNFTTIYFSFVNVQSLLHVRTSSSFGAALVSSLFFLRVLLSVACLEYTAAAFALLFDDSVFFVCVSVRFGVFLEGIKS